MLSYQHGYHAGNFADVLKHSVSIQILNYLTQKSKPLFYLDTHAGCGAFRLTGPQAQKNKEYETGISRLWQGSAQEPTLISDYLHWIKTFNQTTTLTHYPGSPWLAQQILRPQDRLALYERHPREYQRLQQNMRNDARIKTYQTDGFQACLSQLPPREKRGYILMDPSYEVKQDYQTVVEVLKKAHRKFSQGTYALWYPVVDRFRINQLEKAFILSGIQNIQLYELGIKQDSAQGMTSSGMIVINTPWTLLKTMKTELPILSRRISDSDGFFRVEQLVAE